MAPTVVCASTMRRRAVRGGMAHRPPRPGAHAAAVPRPPRYLPPACRAPPQTTRRRGMTYDGTAFRQRVRVPAHIRHLPRALRLKPCVRELLLELGGMRAVQHDAALRCARQLLLELGNARTQRVVCELHCIRTRTTALHSNRIILRCSTLYAAAALQPPPPRRGVRRAAVVCASRDRPPSRSAAQRTRLARARTPATPRVHPTVLRPAPRYRRLQHGGTALQHSCNGYSTHAQRADLVCAWRIALGAQQQLGVVRDRRCRLGLGACTRALFAGVQPLHGVEPAVHAGGGQ